MPYTDEQVAAIQANADKANAELNSLKNDMPGMIKRVAAGLVEEKLKDFKPAEQSKPEVKPEVKAPDAPTVEALRKEIEKLRTDGEDEKKSGLLLGAASKLKFFDPEDVVIALKGKIVKDDSGTFGVKGTEKLSTGDVIEKFLSVEEAVKDYAARKPHLVRADNIKGGTGADGSNNVSTGLTPDKFPKTFKEAMADPRTVAQLYKTPEGTAHMEQLRALNK